MATAANEASEKKGGAERGTSSFLSSIRFSFNSTSIFLRDTPLRRTCLCTRTNVRTHVQVTGGKERAAGRTRVGKWCRRGFLSARSRNGEGRKRASPQVLLAWERRCRERRLKPRKGDRIVGVERPSGPVNFYVVPKSSSKYSLYNRNELVSKVFLNVVFPPPFPPPPDFDLHFASRAEAKLETVRSDP